MTLHAVIVTYHPEAGTLQNLVNSAKASGARVVVADNTPGGASAVLDALVGEVEVIDMRGNAGIAAAQNAGIRMALAQGASVIALFDQDSSPDAHLLPTLLTSLGVPPRGIAAPVCMDMRSGKEYPPYRFNRWGWASPSPAIGQTSPMSVDLIISSGSVVAADVFEHAGLMEESLFIDYVDLEWCIRCRSAGVSIKVIPTAKMPHAIGTKVIEHGPWTTFIHSPTRAYYRLRNAFLLIRMPHVPRLYVLHEVAAALVHHLLQWRHSQDRTQHAQFGWRGLIDGLRGVRGRFEPS